jgi:hypothetical protein
MPAYPQIFRIRQKFEAPVVEDVPAAVRAQLKRLNLRAKVQPNESVAITGGSRGIAGIDVILRSVVESVKGLGAQPFIVPAMGSHGGATASGQQQVLESLGITESYVGCPIRSNMDTVIVCRTKEGFPVHFDRIAYEADHVVVVNRVKPHTRFAGDLESGLMKMMLIGLGKCEGAQVYHRAIYDYSFDQIVRSVASEVLAQCHILAGVAIVENAYEKTARIEAVGPDEMEDREKELLKLAKQWMPRLPFSHVDLLLVDRIGKNLSGTGMDTNIVGRKHDDHRARDDEYPKVRLIAVRGLTRATHGNAVGLGIAELCKSQLLRETDLEKTRLNAIVAGHLPAAMPPLDYETDREILDVALRTLGLSGPNQTKMLWIPDTLHLSEVECSAAYLDEAREKEGVEILTELRSLPLDGSGNLPSMDALVDV